MNFKYRRAKVDGGIFRVYSLAGEGPSDVDKTADELKIARAARRRIRYKEFWERELYGDPPDRERGLPTGADGPYSEDTRAEKEE